MLLKLLLILPAAFLAACGGNTSGLPPLANERYELRNDGACILDAGTGLLWERKLGQAGLRSWNNTYSWFDPSASTAEIDYRLDALRDHFRA